MPEEDPQVKQLIELQTLIDKDKATPEEVAEALHIILQLLANTRKEILDLQAEESGETQRGIQGMFDKCRRLINALRFDVDKEDRAIRKLVEGLLEWKRSKEESSESEDLATALEVGDENTAAIAKLRGALKVLKRTPGPRGPRGRAPAHEWEGTSIRFQNPDLSWGEWVDLQGQAGGSFFSGGPAGEALFALTTSGTSGPATLRNGILNIPQYSGGSSGTSISIADKTSGAINDSNLIFGFASKPLLIIVNNRTYRENGGWTWNAGTSEATLAADPGAVGTGGEIYALIQS